MKSATRRLALVALLLTPGLSAARADQIGAAQSGLWSDSATWTSSSVPGSGDDVFIGGNFPAGSAQTATVTLDGDASAREVRLGVSSGGQGTLDLGDAHLTTLGIRLGSHPEATGAITRGSGSFSARNMDVWNGSTLHMAMGDLVTGDMHVLHGSTVTMGAGARIGNLNLQNSTFATSDSGNIGVVVDVRGAGARLDLGADLGVTSDVNLQNGAELNANGHNLSGRILRLGDTAQLNDRGNLNFAGMEVFGREFNLVGTDRLGFFSLSQGSSSTLGTGVEVGNLSLAFSSRATLTKATNVTGSVNLTTGSRIDIQSDLVIPGSLDARDFNTVVNANGNDMTIHNSLAFFGGATLVNDGAITTSFFSLNGSEIDLNGGNDTVTRAFSLVNGSVLSIVQGWGESTGFTLDIDRGDAITIDGTSTLSLLFGNTPGESWIFRWRGSWIDSITSLIANGRITVSASAGYEVVERDGYTYITQTLMPNAIPEPASVVSLAMGLSLGLGGLWRNHRRRQAAARAA